MRFVHLVSEYEVPVEGLKHHAFVVGGPCVVCRVCCVRHRHCCQECHYGYAVFHFRGMIGVKYDICCKNKDKLFKLQNTAVPGVWAAVSLTIIIIMCVRALLSFTVLVPCSYYVDAGGCLYRYGVIGCRCGEYRAACRVGDDYSHAFGAVTVMMPSAAATDALLWPATLSMPVDISTSTLGEGHRFTLVVYSCHVVVAGFGCTV